MGEWESVTIPLPGGFGDDERAREAALRLTDERRVTIRELRDAVLIETSSYVGSLSLGPLMITIEPKLARAHLATFFRYAYATTRLAKLSDPTDVGLSANGVQELIIQQFLSEAEALVSRGLLRDYRPRDERLASPRGRILFNDIVGCGGAAEASLPCRHYVHSPDTPENQALRFGAQVAGRLSGDPANIARASAIEQLLANDVSIPPTESLSRLLGAPISRRFSEYRPALGLIEILLSSAGIDLSSATSTALSGFLFDMNSLWEDVLERLLHDHAPAGSRVDPQRRIHDLFVFDGVKRQRTPRPDFAWMHGERCTRLLDAKYRELDDKGLTRDMLYQLAVYALSQPPNFSEVVALYPSEDPMACDKAVIITDPVLKAERGRVIIRPVVVDELSVALTGRGAAGRESRRLLVSKLLGAA